MATPIGHSLAGLALGHLVKHLGQASVPAWRWYGLFVLAANAPDLDFIPGLLIGDINRFHQGISHSFAAMLLIGGICATLCRWLGVSAWLAALAGITAYASHLMVDLFCFDGRAPIGIPLLWPFSHETFTASWTIFPGVAHGVDGDDFTTVLRDIFSRRNLAAVGIELAVMVPLYALSWVLCRACRTPGVRSGNGGSG